MESIKCMLFQLISIHTDINVVQLNILLVLGVQLVVQLLEVGSHQTQSPRDDAFNIMLIAFLIVSASDCPKNNFNKTFRMSLEFEKDKFERLV